MNNIAYAALWIFVFAIPADPALGAGSGIIVSKIMGVVALGLALIALGASGRVRRLHPFQVTAFLYVLWVGVGLVLFYNLWRQVPHKFWTYVQLLLVLWMIWELATTRKRLLGLMAAYVLGAGLSAIDTIFLYRRQADVLRRFAAGGIDGNELAMTLALALPMAWYLAMTTQKPLRRWLCGAYLPIGLFAIGLTGSRGGMLATIVALLIVPMTMARLSPVRRAIAIVFVCISGAVAVTYVPQTIIERLATVETEVEGGRLGGRWKIWQAGLKAFTVKPLVGYGPAGYKRAIDPWLLTRAQVAHNSFLSVLVEQGLIGLLLYLMMFFTVWMAVLKLPQLERRFALVMLAALVMTMLSLTAEDSKRVWFVLAALVGLSHTHLVRTGTPVWHMPGAGATAVARSRRMVREGDRPAVPVRNAERDRFG